MANVIEIVVKGRDEGFGSGIDDVDRKAKGLKGTLGEVGKVAGGFLAANVFAGAGQAAIGFFNDSTQAARDMGEAVSKTRTVFGESSAAIEAFANNAAKNLGLSKLEALDMAGTFGNMFTQLGLGVDQASTFSQNMGILASDLASFHNADITDVIEAQSAAFRGEYDSVQRFIPTINAAAVEQRALADTGKRSAAELTAQEKTLATYNLLMEGAGAATGDFARTSDSAANKERIARAEMANMSAEIGQKLLPVATKLTEIKLKLATIFAEKIVPAVEKLVHWFQEHKAVALALAAAIAGPLVIGLGSLVAGFIAANAAVIAIGAAIGVLASLFITHFDTIKAVVMGVFNWIQENWQLLLVILTGPIGLAVTFIINHWETIKNGATAVYDWIVARWDDLVGFVTGLPGRFASAAAGLWDWITDGISAAIAFAIDRINDLIRAYNSIPVAPNVATIGGGKTGSVVRKRQFGGPASGWTMLHELGPEIVKLPSGATVFPAGQQPSGAGPGRGAGVIELHSHIYLDGRQIMESVKKIVRNDHGGDAQAAFGWTI